MITHTILQKLAQQRTTETVAKFEKCINKNSRIIDIGSGLGSIAHLLQNAGHTVQPVDIRDTSIYKDVHPVVYDGKKLPFGDDTFDTALLVTVLHHTPDPECVLQEAKRVARKIIIIEDIYSSTFQKYLTYAMDSICNLEFIGHPHTNKSDEEWKSIFEKLGLNIVTTSYKPFWQAFMSATYILAKD